MLRVNGLDNFEFMKFINEQNRQRSWKLKFHAKKNTNKQLKSCISMDFISSLFLNYMDSFRFSWKIFELKTDFSTP